MSTRSNIKIIFGGTVTYLYRHCDGYPAYNGVDIAAALKPKRPTEFLRTLLSQGTPDTLHGGTRHDYEVTTGWHGDIEWAYVVQFSTATNTARVGVLKIDFGPDRERLMGSLDMIKPIGTAEEFAAFCQEERRKFEKRAEELHAQATAKANRYRKAVR